MEPSRFWLRRDDDDRARQVVYDEVQLSRYTDRQKRAILKRMARGKTASHRELLRAARRARIRPRGERLIAVTLALSALAALILIIAGWRHRPSGPVATETITSPPQAGDEVGKTHTGELTTVMDKADRAWLKDVGAGKVGTAVDGSDVL